MRKDYRPEPMSTLLAFWRDSPAGLSFWVYAFVAIDDGTLLGWTSGGKVLARKIAAQLSDQGRPCKTVKIHGTSQ